MKKSAGAVMKPPRLATLDKESCYLITFIRDFWRSAPSAISPDWYLGDRRWNIFDWKGSRLAIRYQAGR